MPFFWFNILLYTYIVIVMGQPTWINDELNDLSKWDSLVSYGVNPGYNSTYCLNAPCLQFQGIAIITIKDAVNVADYVDLVLSFYVGCESLNINDQLMVYYGSANDSFFINAATINGVDCGSKNVILPVDDNVKSALLVRFVFNPDPETRELRYLYLDHVILSGTLNNTITPTHGARSEVPSTLPSTRSVVPTITQTTKMPTVTSNFPTSTTENPTPITSIPTSMTNNPTSITNNPTTKTENPTSTTKVPTIITRLPTYETVLPSITPTIAPSHPVTDQNTNATLSPSTMPTIATNMPLNMNNTISTTNNTFSIINNTQSIVFNITNDTITSRSPTTSPSISLSILSISSTKEPSMETQKQKSAIASILNPHIIYPIILIIASLLCCIIILVILIIIKTQQTIKQESSINESPKSIKSNNNNAPKIPVQTNTIELNGESELISFDQDKQMNSDIQLQIHLNNDDNNIQQNIYSTDSEESHNDEEKAEEYITPNGLNGEY